MKIGLISDLHLEHRSMEDFSYLVDLINDSEHDVIFNAGDTDSRKLLREHFTESIQKPYFEVLGNHDYYGRNFDRTLEVVNVGGYKVVLCTLWTNFQNDNLAVAHSRIGINDYNFISDVSPIKMINAYYETISFIKKENPDIIVSHFAPTPACEWENYQFSNLTKYFVNNVERNLYFSKLNIRAWLFGHTHHKVKFEDNGILFCNNPLGYPHEFNNVKDYQIETIEL